MPPRQFMRAHGSGDDGPPVKLTGREFVDLFALTSHKFGIVAASFLAMVAGCGPLWMQAIMGTVFQDLGTTKFDHATLVKIVLRILAGSISIQVIMGINFGTRRQVVPRFVSDLREMLYGSLIIKDIVFFDQNPTGLLISRLSQDVQLLQTVLDKFCDCCQNFGQAMGGLLMAYSLMWPAALVATAFILMACLIYRIGDQVINRLWELFNTQSGLATAKAEEIINCFRTIKSFDQEEREAIEYQRSIENVDAVFDKTSVAQGFKDGGITFIINAMSGCLIYVTGYFIVRRPWEGYETRVVWTILLSMIFSAVGFGNILTTGDDFAKARVSAAKLLQIVKEQPVLADRERGDVLASVTGRIEFRDVGFRYAGRKDWAVRHLNFVIQSGETVAFVGESGSGKSTTLQLLLRYYEIEEGAILLDGVDIRTLKPNFLRSHIAMVPQTPVLFSMSVHDNIQFGRTGASRQEIFDAAQIGNAHEFVSKMPQGYNSQVQQTSLSGGQKQRICISRAILANAPILLLDEATAALDTESEQLVHKSLEQFRRGKTAVMVAHRLATVISADRIFVMKNGAIADVGTHQELLGKGGYYADLVKYQLQ